MTYPTTIKINFSKIMCGYTFAMRLFRALLWLDVVGRAFVAATSEMKPTNLIFIMYDDLRPELSIYGRTHMITPNFERLANRSVVFDQAHCQISVCNPSRDSMLTGLRPDLTGTYAFQVSYN